LGLFAPSLKGPAADELRAHLIAFAPDAIVNATAFSARGEDGTSPLDASGCPVFQVALSTARRRDWAASERGLSPADLAMHVALPEVDGRILAGVASFKSPARRDPDLQFSRFAHRPDPARIEAIADRATAHIRLATTPDAHKRIALILSTYPGKGWNDAHAVGLDAPASAEAIAAALATHGYTMACLTFAEIPSGGASAAGGGRTSPQRTASLAARLSEETETWPLAAYRDALRTLPDPLQAQLHAAWGDPEDDPACNGTAFRFRALRSGNLTIALQPERADAASRADSYHDLSRIPRHGYVAFYLWLRAQDPHAIVHIGAHGTLEWLPGKAVALGTDCWPEALTGPLPVFYPFIVNDPGEAAQAKRRIGAVTLGHMPPPLAQSDLPDALHRLDRLLDEYATADGLDPARRTRLIAAIRDEAAAAGIAADLNLAPEASPAEAIPRIDRFVCDLKESRYGEGLHIYGRATGEMEGLLRGLAGQRVAPGPAGSPHRGRGDVLPTGRNLYAVDPRAVPSRTAHAQGVKLAEELLRRHLQDRGDWPRGLVVDLWGSATMRTAGEEFAMALHLAGLAPRWDEGSDRVTGVTVLALAELRRPRIDVTCRVSGLFRDTFPNLPQLFETGAALLADRDEDPADNPYRARTPRVFAPEPGQYGLGMGAALDDYADAGRKAAGEAWIAHSAWSIAADGSTAQDRPALESRLRQADAFAHVQDLAETDVLAASDYAAHAGGFAAALAALGAPAPALWHIDATDAAPRTRTVPEEIARTVRARLAQPGWAAGMMRHGFRGAAEIAATVDHLGQFAHLTRAVPHHLIDIAWDATLDRPEVTAFMARENPGALDALRARFAALRDAGLWVPRRNSAGVPEAAE
jgi:cobaltochelatase CobN